MATANEWGLRQLNCTGAYLNGILDRTIYLIHPLGKVDENGRPIYLECRKTIMGSSRVASAEQSWYMII